MGRHEIRYPDGGERRRHRRWGVGGRRAGRLDSTHQASVLDLSLSGAKIEHANGHLWPETIAFLTLVAPGRETGLKCRVVHSTVHRYEVLPNGERDLIYRSGLEFLDASETSLHVIDKVIDSVKQVS